MGNCCVPNEVMVLKHMLWHLEEQIEAMEEVARIEEVDCTAQRDGPCKKLVEMEHEKQLLEACICQAKQKAFLLGFPCRPTAKTAKSMKWIVTGRKHKATWKKSNPNGNRLPAYVCLHLETTDVDNDSDTSYFSAVSRLDETESNGSYDVHAVQGYPLWQEDSLFFGQDRASKQPKFNLWYNM